MDEDRSRKSSTSRPASGSGCSRKSGSARRRALRSAGTVGVGGAAGGAEEEDEEDFVASSCSQGSRKGQGSEKDRGEEWLKKNYVLDGAQKRDGAGYSGPVFKYP